MGPLVASSYIVKESALSWLRRNGLERLFDLFVLPCLVELMATRDSLSGTSEFLF